MININTKENMNRKIIKIITIFTIIITICLFLNLNTAKATVSSTIEDKSEAKTISNYTIDVEDEEEASNTIKNLILTINSEGMNRDLLTQTLNLYTQFTSKYTNNEIVDMIEQERKELEKNNVEMSNVDSVTSLLKTVDTTQLRKIIAQVDVEEIAAQIENGENIQAILKNITSDMTAVEKVSFIMDILMSANIIKTVLIVLTILFVYRTLLRCVIYKKAGKRAWAPFIPIYRNAVMLKICGMSPWWLLLLLVPVIGWILLFVVSVASKFMLAESFGKGTGFAFGLWLLAPIFETILVFSKKTKYIGFEE